jgi:hypothetical protein
MSTFDPDAYLDAAAAALELPIPPASRAAVAANLRRLHALAQEVLAFEIPEGAPSAVDRASRGEKKDPG